MMSSNQSQDRLFVRNTFINAFEDSDLTCQRTSRRCSTEPTTVLSKTTDSPMYIHYCSSFFDPEPDEQTTHQDPQSITAMDGVHKEQTQSFTAMQELVNLDAEWTHIPTMESLAAWGDIMVANGFEDPLFAPRNNVSHLSGISARNEHSTSAGSPTLQERHPAFACKVGEGRSTHCPGKHIEAPNPTLNGSVDVHLSPVTTLMLRNLPCRLSQEGLANLVDELGFAGTYDLIYIPWGFQSYVGYGFINFHTTEDAARFSIAISSVSFGKRDVEKKITVVAAKDQGLVKNMEAIKKGGNFRRRRHAPLVLNSVR